MQKRMGKPSSRLDKILSDIIVIGSMVGIGIFVLFLSFKAEASYTYEANQSLIDLTGASGTTNLGASDDGVSGAFNIGFTFDYYGQAFTQARVATNGCLHFKTSGVYCNDYTPDPISGQHTYTMYPFWTDLIRDNDSKVLAKSFSDKTVFGWYGLREYNRSGSDNSFEVILWTNDTFEFRYGGLNIINHDVLIGEVGNGVSQAYQYLFHDKCGTGTTNASNCVSANWNATSYNTSLENGGSLYGLGAGNSIDCSNALNDPSCSGYASAYLTQQCDITQLHSETCPRYWEAYDDLQCNLDSQYGPFCPGYRQQESVAFFNEDNVDYGFNQEDMWYDEEYDEWLDSSDPCYENRCEGFTDADWYALDAEQFGQDQVDEWFGTDISFSDDGMVNFDSTPMTSYDDLDVLMDVWDTEQEQHHQEEMLLDEFTFQETFLIEDYSEPETFIEFNSVEELEEWFEEETHQEEERMAQEMAELDEPEEEFIEEIFEEETVEEIFEAQERIVEAEIEEERIEREEAPEEFEENFVEEFQLVEREEAEGKSSVSRNIALRIIASTITTANQSVSGTNSGNSIHATGNSIASGNAVSASSSAGFSTSSSPSMSDQFASSTAQTNQVLNMSSMSVSNSSFNSTSVETETVSTDTIVTRGTVETTQDQMDTSIASVGTNTESETTVENIIAQNLQTAQEQVITRQEETGEYGSENAIIAVMGFLPGFNNYRMVSVPEKELWYEPKSIYTNNTISDNTVAFYGLAEQSINTLTELKNLQPNL
tara:strand:- start:3187 stop:5490 length:2304 start_codon:yes stop_codon:yes gene_type:complete